MESQLEFTHDIFSNCVHPTLSCIWPHLLEIAQWYFFLTCFQKSRQSMFESRIQWKAFEPTWVNWKETKDCAIFLCSIYIVIKPAQTPNAAKSKTIWPDGPSSCMWPMKNGHIVSHPSRPLSHVGDLLIPSLSTSTMQTLI